MIGARGESMQEQTQEPRKSYADRLKEYEANPPNLRTKLLIQAAKATHQQPQHPDTEPGDPAEDR